MLKLEEKIGDKSATIGIVGLGYVGLPLAEAFSKSLKVIGFDTDTKKVNQLRNRQKEAEQKGFYYRSL